MSVLIDKSGWHLHASSTYMQENESDHFYEMKVGGMAMTQLSPIDPNIFSLVIAEAKIDGRR